ncbi:MAG: hypothetical protein K8W52_34220 [Deltaproteobacteria bacterium]|nr:hypothetical protein [Deltaproteobacteria bacterium]
MARPRHGAVVVFVAAALTSGCQYLLGIDDPVPGSDIDAGVCVHSPCDLVDNCGCTGGDTCSWNGNAGEAYCRATDGTAPRSGACNQDTDCADGTMCVVNVCRKACLNDPECGTGSVCRANFDPLLPALACTDACTPVTNAGCPGTDTCVPLQGTDGAFCIPGDTIPDGGVCTDNAFNCVHGAVCYRDSDGIDRCHTVCDPGTNMPCTGTCDSKADLVVGGITYGVCA